MPIYWVNTKGKGLTSSQIAEVENIADSSAFSIARYSIAEQAIHVVVLNDHSKGELPPLPYGLTYDDLPNA